MFIRFKEEKEHIRGYLKGRNEKKLFVMLYKNRHDYDIVSVAKENASGVYLV